MAEQAAPIAAKVLQEWLGVEPDGEWGPATEAAARKRLGDPRDNTGRPWGRKRLAHGVQQAVLKEAGFNVVVDGVIGPETLDALEQWSNGIKSAGMPKVVKAELSWWSQFTDWWFSDDKESPKEGSLTTEPKIIKPRPPASIKLIRQDWPHQKDTEAFFGPKGQNQTRIQLPYPMKIAWEPKTIVTTMVCHKKVAPSVQRCLTAVKDHYDEEEITRLGLDLYGGCLNVRKVRGGNTWSQHSWGVAIDFDPDRNQFRWKSDKARLAKPDAKAFWEIWEAEGWTSLGRYADTDWMHVQAPRFK